MTNKIIPLALGLLSVPVISSAQIRVNGSNSPDYLVREVLAGNGVEIGEVQWVGDEDAAAEFHGQNSGLPIKHGIILSTGQATGVEGPNTGTGTTTGHFGVLTESDNKEIKKYLQNPAYDLCMLEFDFVPTHNKLQFQYVFGSEEYPEYVGASYNDIFVFLLQDPSGKKTNLAVLPGTDIPVSVNSINEMENPQFFQDNNPKRGKDGQKKKKQIGGKLSKFTAGAQLHTHAVGHERDSVLMASIEFDGVTTLLTAEAYVKPFLTYRLKLIVTDVGDNIYDSGIFFAANSMEAVRDPSQPGFVEYMTEDQITAYKNREEAAKGLASKTEEPVPVPVKEEPVVETPEPVLDAEMEGATALANEVNGEQEVVMVKQVEEESEPKPAPVQPEVKPVETVVKQPAPAPKPEPQPEEEDDFIDEEEGGGGTAFVYGEDEAGAGITTESPFLSGREVEFSIIVHFDFDSDVILPKAKDNLDGLAEGIKMLSQPMCIVLGHTDSKGSADYNSELALRRSKHVQAYLQEIGATEDPCWVKQYGEDDPLMSNETTDGRYGNRRVKVVFKGMMPDRE